MSALQMAPHPDWELQMQGAPALSDKKMKAIVDRLQFRPGWTIEFSKGYCVRNGDRCYFHVLHTTQDVRDPAKPLNILFCILSSGIYSEAQLIDAVSQSIRDVENHEFNEWFRYKGQAGHRTASSRLQLPDVG